MKLLNIELRHKVSMVGDFHFSAKENFHGRGLIWVLSSDKEYMERIIIDVPLGIMFQAILERSKHSVLTDCFGNIMKEISYGGL